MTLLRPFVCFLGKCMILPLAILFFTCHDVRADSVPSNEIKALNDEIKKLQSELEEVAKKQEELLKSLENLKIIARR